MDYVAAGWLVWVTWLVGDVGIRSVHGVFAVGWQWWGTVWADVLLLWGPQWESFVGGWVL